MKIKFTIYVENSVVVVFHNIYLILFKSNIFRQNSICNQYTILEYILTFKNDVSSSLNTQLTGDRIKNCL